MSDTEKKILNQLEEILPKLNDIQKARLLGLSEGLFIATERDKQTA